MEHVAVELLCSFRTRAVPRNETIRQAIDETPDDRAKEVTVWITKLRLAVPRWNRRRARAAILSREGTGITAGRSGGESLWRCPSRRAPSRRLQPHEYGR